MAYKYTLLTQAWSTYNQDVKIKEESAKSKPIILQYQNQINAATQQESNIDNTASNIFKTHDADGVKTLIIALQKLTLSNNKGLS